ncbi:MAG: SulP family inorganic anion transporter, partial [Novosphingobium sp.]
RAEAMFLLTFVTGVLIVAGALLRVGRMIKYVSQPVLTGLLLGIAVVLVLDQLGPLLGYAPTGPNKPAQAVDLLLNLRGIDLHTAVIGLGALGIAIGLGRTRWHNWASLAALVVPTLLLIGAGWEQVRTVADVAPINGGPPPFSLPAIALIDGGFLLSAATLAMVILVQGAGVTQSVVNLDGSPVDGNRDIFAQGVANTAAGLFSGIPAGGSVGQTALNVEVGAQTRWSGIFGALVVLACLIALPGVISLVPVAVLGALMIVAGVSAFNLREARALWSVGPLPRLVAGATFVTCLFVSIAAAVGVGVLLSAVLALSNEARDVRVVRIVARGDDLIEAPVPAQLDEHDPIVVLDVIGSLFFAGARSLGERLPLPGDAARPVVILRLRGYIRAGATLVDVLDNYADTLASVGGRLYLTGLGDDLHRRLAGSLKFSDGNDPHLVRADPVFGVGTKNAVRAAYQWRSQTSEERTTA